MTTYTGSLAAATVQPRSLHAGNWSQVFAYKSTTTLSNGDAILMGKIPHGATIVDLYAIHVGGEGDTGLISVGIDDSLSDIIASQSTSAGAVIRWDANLPYTVSVSDDATIRYHVVKIGIDADYTATNTFKVVVTCTSDP